MAVHPDVEAYIASSTGWPDEMGRLRQVLLGCDLTEQIKWAKPCYSFGGDNIVVMQEMKDFLALMFFKGALLDDPHGILESQGPNSRSARRMVFGSVDDVERLAPMVETYVAAAVEARELDVGPPPELVLVDELQECIDADPAFKAAFESLTPGRRREYHLYVSGAKQATTRRARVDKHYERILAGKGLRDR